MSQQTEKYTSLHPEYFEDEWKENWMDESLVDLLRKINEGYSTQQLIDMELVKEVAPGIYSIPMFSHQTCENILAEAENFLRFAEVNDVKVHRPNSMNNYGLVLNLMGMKEVLTSLQQSYLLPVSRHIFPVEASEFTNHHSFM